MEKYCPTREIAKALDISRSAVSRRAKKENWPFREQPNPK